MSQAQDRVLREFILSLANTDMAHGTSYANGLISLLEPAREAELHEIANVLLLAMQTGYSLAEIAPRAQYSPHVNQMIVEQWIKANRGSGSVNG